MDRLGTFQLYPPKTKFDKKDGWQYMQMHMIFDLKQQDLRHKTRLVVGVNVVDSMEHTKHSPTIKDVSLRLILLIGVNNWLVLMSGCIKNALCTDRCAEKIWS